MKMLKSPQWLDRTRLLVGENGLEQLRKSHVLVLGLGGFGGMAAEMIARGGVGEMTIVDGDVVETTNRNRQIPALVSTNNRPKTEVLKERLLDINPELKLHVWKEYICDGKIEELLRSPYDYAIDAIDSLSPKVHFIASCVQKEIPLIASMGSGGRVDPSLVRIGDISETHHCKLAKAVRSALGKLGIRHGVEVVWSPEEVPPEAVLSCCDEQGRRHSYVGTISYMPGIFGSFAASQVLRNLLKQK